MGLAGEGPPKDRQLCLGPTMQGHSLCVVLQAKQRGTFASGDGLCWQHFLKIQSQKSFLFERSTEEK